MEPQKFSPRPCSSCWAMCLARCEPAKSPREARRLATRDMRECASENRVLNWEKEKERDGGGEVRRRRKNKTTGKDAAVVAIFFPSTVTRNV